MPLGMKVGLSPGDFVLDGDPAPVTKKGAEPPNFVLGEDPALPPRKEGTAPTEFLAPGVWEPARTWEPYQANG